MYIVLPVIISGGKCLRMEEPIDRIFYYKNLRV